MTDGAAAIRNFDDLPAWFISRVDRSDEKGCWRWTGYIGRLGYGRLPRRAGTSFPHRFIYEFLVAEIPEGMTIDHLCCVRHCVNPIHMEVVTRGVNTLRGTGPTAINKRKTHCSKGHAFSESNSIKNKRGRRICKECHRQSDLIYWRRVRAK